ncbi:unnamed protein product [Tenebrio molitor]|nr:unnamed protein product [Tenebrio molitor]
MSKIFYYDVPLDVHLNSPTQANGGCDHMLLGLKLARYFSHILGCFPRVTSPRPPTRTLLRFSGDCTTIAVFCGDKMVCTNYCYKAVLVLIVSRMDATKTILPKLISGLLNFSQDSWNWDTI